MKYVVANLIFFLTLFSGHAQEERTDSLIYFKELEFNSEIERENFLVLLAGDESSLFEGFMNIKLEDEELVKSKKKNLYYQFDQLKEIKRGKKNAKYLKKIYDELHLRFLRKYEEIISFESVFEDGRYNCVTASALYGMAFDHLDIDYTIKETPTHVYIVAYPDQDQIVVETTDPVNGFRNITDGFKRNFISILQQQKLIDSNELSAGIDSLFDKYYYSADEVDLKQLLGLQYYNMGVASIQEKEYKEALSNFGKAYFLYSSKQITDMLFASISLILSEVSYENPDDVKYLGMINRFRSHEISDAEIEGEFGRLTQAILFDKNDTVAYDSAYNILTQMIPKEDSSLRRQIDYIYHYERGRVLYNRAYYSQAIPFAERAYELKQESIESETLLIACFSNIHINASAFDALNGLNKLLDSYPSLTNNKRLGSIWLNLHLQMMYESFVERKTKLGFEYKSQFEKLALEYPGFKYDRKVAGSAYAQLVAHYFRRGQMSLARKSLREGFVYSPNNPELKIREYALNR